MSLPADGPWDPEVIHRITTLSLRARQQVEGLRLGVHASRRVTSNVEFADYKEYSPGDPLRDLDWRVAARSDPRPVVTWTLSPASAAHPKGIQIQVR